MRKQTKLVAVLSAAALLAIGASMTSFAAKGWAEENGTWYYYDNNGDAVTNDWKKSGNNWFWLDEDGAMATSTLVEDNNNQYYYVNGNGAMVTNSWVAIEPGEDADADAPDHYWYYFGANGKAYKTSTNSDKDITIKTVNGKKYGFDKEGKMFYGWVSEEGDRLNDEESPFQQATYYFGDAEDGAMHTDWLQYNDGSDLSSGLTNKDYADQDVIWLFFNTSTGKMVKADETKGKLTTKTVRGQKYAFDENGVMVYDWNNVATPNRVGEAATANQYFSEETDGHLRKNTWVWAIPDASMNQDDHDDETSRWFYVEGSGKTVKNTIKSLKGKKYMFDENGIMKAGLVVAENKVFKDKVDAGATNGYDLRDDLNYTNADGDSKNRGSFDLYYFGDEETDGSMKTGKSVKVEFQDDTYTMAFEKSSGKAMNKKDGTKIYKNGFLATADADMKYQTVKFDDGKGDGEKVYVVGTTGTIVKAGSTAKDADGNYYAVYKEAGVAALTEGDDVTVKHDTVKEENAGLAKFDGDDEYAQQKARDYANYGHIRGCVDTENDKWISAPKDNQCN